MQPASKCYGAASRYPVLSHREADGIFEALLPAGVTERPGPQSYRLRVNFHDGHQIETEDPYAFSPTLTDFDLHLLAEGRHYDSYEKLGAHATEVEGVRGATFAVWAPNALRVSVVGDFNGWDGRVHPMRLRGSTGMWELFLPRLADGAVYKFEIRSSLGNLPFLKADPYEFQGELRPKTGSVVATLGVSAGHQWKDQEWMSGRSRRDWLSEPIAIYEAHSDSWRRVVGSRAAVG